MPLPGDGTPARTDPAIGLLDYTIPVYHPARRFIAEATPMARIPDTEIERLKAEVSVERLVEASGIELKRGGKDSAGR